MFFDSWSDVIRVFAVGVPAYAALVFFLRISGKRTLTKLNAFDLVITVAMGSTLANILLSSEVSLTEGAAALGLLVLLQFLITWTSVRSSKVHRMVKAQPALLFYRNRFLDDALVKERVTRQEVAAAARTEGFPDLESVGAVVLETDGSMAVVPTTESPGKNPTLEGVRYTPDASDGPAGEVSDDESGTGG